MNAATTQPGPPARSRVRPANEPVIRYFSMRRTTSLTLGLLLVVVLIAVYALQGLDRSTPTRDQDVAWAACSMLVVTAIVILLLGRAVTQQSLRVIEEQLRLLVGDERLTAPQGPVPEELQPALTALCRYAATVHDRVEHLRLQKKELDIQMRVAETERQNTEAIIFSISDAVLVIDSFGELVLANTAAEQLFSFRFSEWRHRPIDRVVEDPTLLALLKNAQAMEDRTTRRQVEYSTLRRGKAHTFNITLSKVIDKGGECRGRVAVFHDITREREIAQIKSDFVSAVSHELRTPLSSIKAYMEMLVDGEVKDDKTRGDFYGIIQSETDRLQRLISNVLNISRIESGVVEIRREPISANEVIREVAAVMQPHASQKCISMSCRLEESAPAIWADHDLLYQAVLNVVSNAIKYTQREGQVAISTHTDRRTGHVAVSIEDNGVGIQPEDLPHVFEKFYRSRRSLGMAKGTGLGLNLVKHIVETAHGGDISITSEVGAGTTVVLRFPCLRTNHHLEVHS